MAEWRRRRGTMTMLLPPLPPSTTVRACVRSSRGGGRVFFFAFSPLFFCTSPPVRKGGRWTGLEGEEGGLFSPFSPLDCSPVLLRAFLRRSVGRGGAAVYFVQGASSSSSSKKAACTHPPTSSSFAQELNCCASVSTCLLCLVYSPSPTCLPVRPCLSISLSAAISVGRSVLYLLRQL